MRCWIDTETRSPTPINRGTDRYSDLAEIILTTWTLEDEGTQCWDRLAGEAMPPDLDWILDDSSGVELIAHEAVFDRTAFRKSINRPTDISRWRCTKAQAYAHGLPGALETLGIVLGLPPEDQKLVDDKGLIKLFCIPYDFWPNGSPKYYGPWSHPEEWKRFKRYAAQDSATLKKIDLLLPTHNYKGHNLQLWHEDQTINQRGFGFDEELALAARKVLDDAKVKQDAETWDKTGGYVKAATQRQKLLDWLNNSGLEIANLKAATIREWLDHDDLDPVHRAMLELRLEASKSSGSKYRRGLEIVGLDKRVRNSIQFGGAGRTGRFSGRGFQPHNMMRPVTSHFDEKQQKNVTIPVKWGFINDVIIPGIKSLDILKRPELYGGPNEACANALRGAIVANQTDHELVVADWSNIEGRVLAWIAGEEWKLEAYRAQDRGDAVDGYRLLVHKFFGLPLDAIDDNWRQVGKVIDLSCGFAAAVGAFVTMAAGYNIDLDMLPALVLPKATEEQLAKARKTWRRAFLGGEDYGLEPATFIACHVLVQAYRETNAKIKDVWHEVDKATKMAVKNPGQSFNAGKCTIWATGTPEKPTWLIIQLPNGDRLYYCAPRIEVKEEQDVETGKKQRSEYISYMTARGKQWRREKAWHGLFVENIVQAIANRILRAGLLNVNRHSWTVPEIAAYLMTLPPEQRTIVSLHVHDEITCDLPKGLLPLKTLIALITTDLQERNQWMTGLPLAAAGWTGPRYHK